MDIKTRLIVLRVLTIISVVAFIVALYTGIEELVGDKAFALEAIVGMLATALIVAGCWATYNRARRRAGL